MLAKLFCMIGFLCAPIPAYPISGYEVARSAQSEIFTPLIFEWNAICPFDQTRPVGDLWRNAAAVITEIENKLPGVVHGMTPNWTMQEGVTLRVPDGVCTYILDGEITLPAITISSPHLISADTHKE